MPCDRQPPNLAGGSTRNDALESKRNTLSWLVGFGFLAVIVCTVLLGLAVWFIFVVLDGPSEQDIDEAMKQGDIILAAIEEYHDENGNYPFALADLVPHTLAKIPSPTGEAEFWEYRLWQGGSKLGNREFQLSHDWGGWFLFQNPVIYSTGSMWSIDTK